VDNNVAPKDQDQATQSTTQSLKCKLPTIALLFGLAPVILQALSYFPLLGYVFAFVYIISWWGLFFQFIGFFIGLIAICDRIFSKIKMISVKGFVISIIAVICPVIWFFILNFLDKHTSVELWL